MKHKAHKVSSIINGLNITVKKIENIPDKNRNFIQGMRDFSNTKVSIFLNCFDVPEFQLGKYLLNLFLFLFFESQREKLFHLSELISFHVCFQGEGL